MPYIYTAFHTAHTDGQPVMAPVFFADLKDQALRAEEQAFMLGTDILVVPAFAKNPSLPKGIWEELSLIKGDTKGKYQSTLKVRGEGWEFQKGDYKLFSFEAGLQDEHHLTLKLVDSKGTGRIDLGVIKVEVLHKGKLYKGSGTLDKTITIKV